MTELSSTPGTATLAEVVEALTNLSPSDLLRIKQIAKLRGAPLVLYSWEDLVNEAIKRTLDGSRLWPQGVPFVAFLAQTIRSIASDERRSQQLGFVTTEADLAVGPSGDAIELENVARESVDPERISRARQALRDVEALFARDDDALLVLHGLAEGSTPQEIQNAAGMTPTRYATVQRRIRREIARRYPGQDYNP